MIKDVTDVEIVVAPPFTALHAVAEAARNTNIGVSAQDVYWEREGAFTGEISPVMIKEAGAEYVIVGHSERRRLFGESDQIVNRKAMAAIAAELIPIVCIGETLEERERNETFGVLDRQIKEGLNGLAPTFVVCVRARLGDRDRPERLVRPGRRGARAHSWPARRVVWRRGGRSVPGDLRRQRQAGEHPRAHQSARRRRRARRGRKPRRRRLRGDRDRQPFGCGIIHCFLNLVIWSSSYLVIDWSIAQPIQPIPNQ